MNHANARKAACLPGVFFSEKSRKIRVPSEKEAGRMLALCRAGWVGRDGMINRIGIKDEERAGRGKGKT